MVDALEQSMLMLIPTLKQHIEPQKEYGEAVKTVERLHADCFMAWKALRSDPRSLVSP